MALAQYSELFWFPSGELAASVPARVFLHSSNTLATLYADAGGTTPLANPLSTSGTGRLEFWAEEGRYWVHIDSEAFEVAVGAAVQPATQQDIADEVIRADAAYAPIEHAASHEEGGSDEVTLTQAQITGLVQALAALLPLTGGTITGTLTIEDGQLVLDSTGTAINAVDRGNATAYAAYVLRTAGVDRWAWQMVNDGTHDLVLTDSANGVEVMRVTPGEQPGLNFPGFATFGGGQFNGGLFAFGDLQLIGTGKRYRLRRSGDALDFEGSGVDMILSMWSGEDFTGTQRPYARFSADAHNVQWAGKFESVASLYGAAVHTLDPATGVASMGGKNGLSPIRLAGYKATAGAPAAGTWEAGEVVLDSAGAWHLCTEGGAPGTWT